MMKTRRGFTLIEILVVMAILVILVSLALVVGVGAKTSAQTRQTRMTLHALDLMEKDYLAAGNAEPVAVVDVAGTIAKAGGNTDLATTIPQSDATRWVKLFKAFPETASKLGNFATGTVTDPDDISSKATVILDAFGTPIRYVPSNNLGTNNKDGYFESAGPDHVFETVNPQPTNKLPPDDIYSTDPL